MEYARRRNRRRRRRSDDTGSLGRAVAALLMVGAIVYLVAASSAGEWIAQKIIAPVIEVFSGEKTKPAEDTDLVSEPQGDGDAAINSAQVNLSTDKNSVSAEITLPAVSTYMLQMGVFSTEQNALVQAQLLKPLGGGGYILPDGERFRVMAAGYTSEASAKEVKDRLKAEGVDCLVHPLTSASASFRVTAPETQLESIKTGFGALAAAQSALSETAMMFDPTSGDIEKAKVECQSALSDLTARMAVIEGYGESGNAVLTRLLSCYDAYKASFGELITSNAETVVAFSSQIKYTQMYLTHEYVNLINAFGI